MSSIRNQIGGNAEQFLKTQEQEAEKDLKIKELEKKVAELIHQRMLEEEFINSIPDSFDDIEKSEGLTANQKLLICDYLGFLDIIEKVEATTKGKLLGLLFGSDDSNLRKSFSKLETLKSQANNLETIHKTFTDLKLTKYADKVKKDMKE